MATLADARPANHSSTEVSKAAATVVINTYNDSHFLGEAIESVVNQRRAVTAIIVVDDGSTVPPDAVVARYPGVRLLKQANQGLAGARNTGLAAVTTEYVAFLDADDRLLPNAIEVGIASLESHPEAVFTYGGYRRIDVAGRAISSDAHTSLGDDPFRRLLLSNAIGMHATVMYRTAQLRRVGAFDRSLRLCEDYDLYLRVTRDHAVASHTDTVAEYRWHGDNISGNPRRMATAAMGVLERHAGGKDAASGFAQWKRYYSDVAVRQALSSGAAKLPARLARLNDAVAISPGGAATAMAKAGYRWIKPLLPKWLADQGRRILRGERPLGTVRMGDLARIEPVHPDFGWSRGTPVDRFYIERFLEANRADIKGTALEVGDDSYCRRFGGKAITRQEVLHVNPDAPGATIIGDLSDPATLPSERFDCIVLTQTLHLVFDLQAAVAALHRSLKPGGVLLLTVPGISQVDRNEWGGESWLWAMTPAAVRKLFVPTFGAEQCTVAGHGNVYSSTAFLQGMVVEELERAKLEVVDPAFPMTVTLRAQRRQ